MSWVKKIKATIMAIAIIGISLTSAITLVGAVIEDAFISASGEIVEQEIKAEASQRLENRLKEIIEASI